MGVLFMELWNMEREELASGKKNNELNFLTCGEFHIPVGI